MIPDGIFLVVAGHNGSGKSTLSKHINGLLLPTEGQVLVNGLDTRDENNLLSIRQQVGMVFQYRMTAQKAWLKRSISFWKSP